MELIKDIKSIVFQVLGKENMFGFKTTLANQMYLIYCVMGNFFYIDNVNRITKFAWFCSVYSGCFYACVSLTLYLLYGRSTGDIIVLIYVAFVCILFFLEFCLRPAIMFSYKHDVEQTIQLADQILMKKQTTESRHGDKMQLNAKEIAVTASIAYCVPFVLYTSNVALNMIFFFDEENIKNCMSYPFPLCGLEHFTYVKPVYLHIFISSTIMWQAIFFLTVCTANRTLAVLWVVICHNEAQRIMNELNSLSTDADININNYKSIEPKFKQVIRRSIRDINDLTRLISTFRGYFEANASVLLPILLYVVIIHAFLFVLPGFPIELRVNELLMFVGTISEVYTVCWVGAKLEEMTTAMSFAVYSTPWYWIKGIRKDVYIFLCQTQAPINPLALNVYPLTLATFLRFCNVINSTVNVARAAYARKN